MKEEKENKKKKIILILVPLLLLIIVLCYFSFRVKSESKETSDKNVSGIQININEKDSTTKERKTRILGDSNNYLSIDNRYLYLQNDASNNVYFQFDIVENGTTIYSSELIEPGMMEKLDAYSLFSKGEHNLEYLITTYNLESKEVCLSDVKQLKTIVIY